MQYRNFEHITNYVIICLVNVKGSEIVGAEGGLPLIVFIFVIVVGLLIRISKKQDK